MMCNTARSDPPTLSYQATNESWPEFSLGAHHQGPVVQSVVSLTSSLRVISLTVLADSIHNILIFFAEKNVSTAKATHIFSAKNFNIFANHDVNFNESLTNDIVSFEQLGPGICSYFVTSTSSCLIQHLNSSVWLPADISKLLTKWHTKWLHH